jgi:predicted Zn-dependent protease
MPVTRCFRCGTRSAASAGAREFVFTCESCGLPFVAGELLPHAEQRCPDCRSGGLPAGLPDERIAAAAETEIRAALAGRFPLVSLPPVSAYLDRIAAQVAQRIEDAPEGTCVVLVDDPGLKTLALPSGTLLVSTGTLAFLEDEAELAFVLGHEIAHAASEDAAVRLVRLGFRAVARGGPAPDREAWTHAALDLVRLGYGRRRERDADLRSLEAMLALGYDPRSAVRYLRRLRAAVLRGDPALAELASAHPPADERGRRIEKAIFGRVPEQQVARVNREVFRRVVVREVLSGAMTPYRFEDAAADEEPRPRRRRLWPWIVLAAVGLAAAVAVIAILRL